MLCQICSSIFWKLEVTSVHSNLLGEKFVSLKSHQHIPEVPERLWISRHHQNVVCFCPINKKKKKKKWGFLTHLLQLNCSASEVTERNIRPVMSSSENPPQITQNVCRMFVVHPHTFLYKVPEAEQSP